MRGMGGAGCVLCSVLFNRSHPVGNLRGSVPHLLTDRSILLLERILMSTGTVTFHEQHFTVARANINEHGHSDIP